MVVSTYWRRAHRQLFPHLLDRCGIVVPETRQPKCSLSYDLLCILNLRNAKSRIDNRHIVFQRHHAGAGHNEPGTAGGALLAINPLPPGEPPRSIPVGSNMPTVPGANMPGKATLLEGKHIAASCSNVPCDGTAPPQLPTEKAGNVPAGHNWPLPATSSHCGGLTTVGAAAFAPRKPAVSSPFAV